MIFFAENLKELTKIFLESISDYSKGIKHKVNIQKSMISYALTMNKCNLH